MYRKVLLLCLATILIIISWYGLDSAAFSQTSRVTNLDADISRLETRLNRVEAQLSQLTRGQTPVSPVPAPTNSGRKQPQLSREQMFDNLATLVVETKEQVNKLQARVSKLEKLRNPS
jgi:BMFP domain-containing protein YqiC